MVEGVTLKSRGLKPANARSILPEYFRWPHPVLGGDVTICS